MEMQTLYVTCMVSACCHGHSIWKRRHLKSNLRKNDREFFAAFVREHFNLSFAHAGPKADG